MTTRNIRRMPSRFYEGAPAIIRDKVAFMVYNGPQATGCPYDILFRERVGEGYAWSQAQGLDFGDGLRGQHFFLWSGEITGWKARNSRKRVAWSDIPQGVQETIIGYLEA